MSTGDFSKEDRAFIARAVAFCDRIGPDSVVLLVGSRAAGLIYEGWADLDLWIVGHRDALSESERATYDRERQLFVDRGDLEAHFSFYDIDDMEAEIEDWPDAKMWLLSTCKIVHGSLEALESLIEQSKTYPKGVAEEKLRYELGRFMIAKGGCLSMSARSGEAATSIVAVGEIVDAVCKICCLAEGVPYPYAKWRVTVARETRLGKQLFPSIDRAIAHIDELVATPSERNFREWVPVSELRSLKDKIVAGLRELGWQGAWLDEPEENMAMTF